MAALAKPSSGLAQAALIAAVLIALSAALVAGYFLFFRREMAVLYQDLRPTEASAVVAELKAQNVSYEVRDGGARILVPAAGIDAIRLNVAASELPVKGLDGFELFDDTDMGLTDFAQKIKYQRALQGELARTIMRMDGVMEARVHVSIPERSVFRNDRSQPKAAVALVTRSADFETSDRIEGIQQLVAASIADLSTSDVVVINEHGKVISARPSDNSPAATASISAEPKAEDLGRSLAEALGRAIPDRRFAVSIIPAEPGGVEETANATAGEPKAPLPLVRVLTDATLSPAEQENARSRILADAALAGAQVAFEIDPTLAAPDAPRAPAPLTSPPVPKASETLLDVAGPRIAPQVQPWLLAAGASGLAIVLAILVWRLGSRRSALAVDDQRQFADRFKLGLQPSTQERPDEA